MTSTPNAQSAPDAAQLTELLNQFLAGASRNDPATHDRFWAEDLIYTGSSGRRIGKREIMSGLRSPSTPAPAGPKTTYSAEEIRIQQYGDTAIVAFRLVGVTERDGNRFVAHYLNSGTFRKRNGEWKVVNWHATKLPRREDEAKREVAAADASFRQAVLSSNLKTLEALTDEAFIWVQDSGQQLSRKQLLQELVAGRMRFSHLEKINFTIAYFGETAVVRGETLQNRRSLSSSKTTANEKSVTVGYTMTLINRDGAWKVIAMHSCTP
jgi:ketosteroid isomerase-like protein